MEDGEREWVRVEVEEGESVRPSGSAEVEAMGSVDTTGGRREEPDFGLSLPVGPLPRGGLFAGGRLRAALRVLFSSSSSATLSSSAYKNWRCAKRVSAVGEEEYEIGHARANEQHAWL